MVNNSVPNFHARDLFFGQRTRKGNAPRRILVTIETTDQAPLRFEIYAAFSRNLMVNGENQKITRKDYDQLVSLRPVFIPGTIGITTREEFLRVVSQERLISEGRQNQVLRNLVYRLSQTGVWQDFTEIVAPLFRLEGLEVPFNVDSDEWLTAVYREAGCNFDFVSAGSGFLQVVNLLSFLLLHVSKVALLDEPDSHMHDDLQRLTFEILDELSRKQNIQLIIASHSPTLIDAAGLGSVLLIDKSQKSPLRAKDIETLVPLLGDRGLAPPPAKVMNTLKTRRCVFVEGLEADYQEFIERIGEVAQPGFRVATRGLTVFETGGATKKWPFEAIECFEQLIGVPLKYVFVSDRDFLTDAQVEERKANAEKQGRTLVHLERRHRESYLLEPDVIERMLKRKWDEKNPGKLPPAEFDAAKLREFVLEFANSESKETTADFMVFHRAFLRGDDKQFAEAFAGLHEYFKVSYTDLVAAGHVPYKLLDAKKCLRRLRTHLAKEHQISFSDRDIIDSMQMGEIAPELSQVLEKIASMFEKKDVGGVAKQAVKNVADVYHEVEVIDDTGDDDTKLLFN